MRSPTRTLTSLAALAIGSAGLGLVWAGCADPVPSRPNVVLIVIDSLRADHLDHLGYERPTASPLDGFRDEAVLFAEASTPAPWTLPSSASLLTGLFPTRHRLITTDRVLGEPIVTLAEHLQAHGYATAALTHHPKLSRELGFAQGFQHFESSLGDEIQTSDVGEMLPWLREWLAGATSAEPFFLYLHAMNPGSYRVPEDRRGILLGRPASTKLTYRKAVVRGLTNRPSRVTDAEIQAVVDQYDTAARYTLDRVAELLRLLDRSGSYQDALVVIAGDHGEELFEHGLIGHGRSLHRAALHVPLYVRPPGGTRGRTVTGPVTLLDVVPTLLELLDLPALTGDGVSLAPQVQGRQATAAERPTFHHTRLASPSSSRAIVDGRYKLVERRRGQILVSRKLFDLSLDPGENHDRSSQGREVAERLTVALREAFRDFAMPLRANRGAAVAESEGG